MARRVPFLASLQPLYLETNGTQPTVLADTLDDLDYVSMDIKLASVCGFETPWDLHREFLLQAKEKVCCVKVVVDMHTPVSEVVAAAELLKEIAKDTPLIIQPLTREDQIHISSSRLLELQSAALQLLPDVRIIPQTHRFLDLL
jgi:organic radical activating enzyme